MRKRPTIEEVGRIAGVSASSASRALNYQAGRPETIRRVVEAAEAIGYRPNSAARSLKLQRTEQIALAVPDIANPVYAAVMKAIQDVVGKENYRLVIYSTDGDPHAETAVVQTLAHNHVDGLIFVPIRLTEALRREIAGASVPVVIIGTVPDELDVDNVRVDSRRGALLAVEHLLAEGNRRIAFVGAAADTVPGRERLQGYRDGLRAVRVKFDARLVVAGDFRTASGAAAVEALLDGGVAFDSLFCANDLVALGAIHALRRRGRRVPDDVAVVGMDNVDLGALVHPTLTSVSLSAGVRGELAAGLMLGRLSEPRREGQRLTIEPTLVVRESSTRSDGRTRDTTDGKKR